MRFSEPNDQGDRAGLPNGGTPANLIPAVRAPGGEVRDAGANFIQ